MTRLLFTDFGTSVSRYYFQDGIDSFTNIVDAYNRDLDRRVQFPQLAATIQTLDDLLLNYQGSARAHMAQLRPMYSNASNAYHASVAPVFNWCVSCNNSLAILIRYTKRAQPLADRVAHSLYDMTHQMLDDGYAKTQSSRHQLESVIAQTSAIADKLRAISFQLVDDFGPTGVYGQLARQRRRRRRRRRSLMGVLRGGWALLQSIARFVYDLVQSVVGFILQLGARLKAAGVSLAVIAGRQAPSAADLQRTVDTMFDALRAAVKASTDQAIKVGNDLWIDHTNVNRLAGFISGANWVSAR